MQNFRNYFEQKLVNINSAKHNTPCVERKESKRYSQYPNSEDIISDHKEDQTQGK